MSKLNVPQNFPTDLSSIRKDSKHALFRDVFHLGINVHQKPFIPVVEAKPGNYTPMPYIFRLERTSTPNHILNETTKVPPFYVQLDHTIAVVWGIFSKEQFGKKLGINQLQWALAFLNTIRNSNDRVPKDVAFCVELLTDLLMDQYSELAKVCPSKGSKMPEPIATSSKNEIEIEVEAPPAEEERPAEEGEAPADGEDKPEEQTAPKPEKETAGELRPRQDRPFSYNYADMIARSPKKPLNVTYAKEAQVEDDYKNMGAFLKRWRKDQMRKILMELDRLQSIEAYMGSYGENFNAYMDDKDKDISLILSEKLKNYKN